MTGTKPHTLPARRARARPRTWRPKDASTAERSACTAPRDPLRGAEGEDAHHPDGSGHALAARGSPPLPLRVGLVAADAADERPRGHGLVRQQPDLTEVPTVEKRPRASPPPGGTRGHVPGKLEAPGGDRPPPQGALEPLLARELRPGRHARGQDRRGNDGQRGDKGAQGACGRGGGTPRRRARRALPAPPRAPRGAGASPSTVREQARAATSAQRVSGSAGLGGGAGTSDTDHPLHLGELLLAYARDAHEVLGRGEGAIALAVLHDRARRGLADAGKLIEFRHVRAVDVYQRGARALAPAARRGSVPGRGRQVPPPPAGRGPSRRPPGAPPG